MYSPLGEHFLKFVPFGTSPTESWLILRPSANPLKQLLFGFRLLLLIQCNAFHKNVLISDGDQDIAIEC